MTEAPTVSVVIPAYNAAWCVGRAIDSVLAQSFGDFEIIVVDDGSTDTTPAVLGAYGDAIQVVRQINGGMSHARNTGIQVARGTYLAFLDADDHWLPEKLARQVELMKRHTELAFCSTTARLEDPEGQPAGVWGSMAHATLTVADVFADHTRIAGGASSVLARRSAVLTVGGFDETLHGAEDTDLWLRLAAHGGYRNLVEAQVVVVKRPDSVSRNRAAMRRGALAMTRKNRALLPRTLQGGFWRGLYAGTLCDYAKWAYREGEHWTALRDLGSALLMSPLGRGRLALGLLIAILLGQKI